MSISYTFRPRPLGTPVVLSLKGRTLTIAKGLSSRDIDMGQIASVRLVYEPKGLAQRTFATKFSVTGGKRQRFSSGSWSGLAEVRSQGPDYVAFQRAFLDAVAKYSPKASFVAGRPFVIWAVGAIALLACFVVFAAFIVRSVQDMNFLGLLAGGAFTAIGIWQIAPMMMRNRPRAFDPRNPPPELLPPV